MQQGKFYYKNAKGRFPIEYQVSEMTDGNKTFKNHVIYYSNSKLIGQSLKEVVNCLEKILYGEK
jgi:hypothetical protein